MPFGSEARAAQARFRDTLPEPARSPSDPVGRRHGHLLALGHEAENLHPELRGPDGAEAFFRARGIHWWKSTRSGDGPGEGPTRNLASSQVACVNFLLPLARRPAALLAVVRAIDPEVTALEPIPDPGGAAPSLVEFEWVGWEAPLEGGRLNRGAMQTSADALVLGHTSTGLRALVFEWKYCEEYLRPEDKGAGPSGDTRRRRYLGRYHARDGAFRGDVPLDELLFEPYYQLLRLRLLADELARSGVGPELPVHDAKVVVVCPEANRDYRVPVASTPLARRFPGRATVVELMRDTVRDPAGFELVAPARLVDGAAGLGELAAWVGYQRGRYGG